MDKFSGKKQSMLIDYPLNKINYTSSRGPASDGRVKPDVTAPGGMIFSAVSSYSDYYKESSANTVARATINGKSYYWGQMTGTSQASPFVAGVIATWLEANPELSPEDIQLILKRPPAKIPIQEHVPTPFTDTGNRRSRRNQRGAFTERHRQLVDRQTIQTLSRRNFIHIASG